MVADPGDRSLGPDRERFLESFTGVVALALTRARLGEERVRRLALEETDKLRTVLLQSVSHDLRTPLTTIKATAEMLRDGDLDAGRRRQLLADVEQEVDRLSHLVTNLLDLSRIESGSLQLERAARCRSTTSSTTPSPPPGRRSAPAASRSTCRRPA